MARPQKMRADSESETAAGLVLSTGVEDTPRPRPGGSGYGESPSSPSSPQSNTALHALAGRDTGEGERAPAERADGADPRVVDGGAAVVIGDVLTAADRRGSRAPSSRARSSPRDRTRPRRRGSRAARCAARRRPRSVAGQRHLLADDGRHVGVEGEHEVLHLPALLDARGVDGEAVGAREPS